MKFRYSVALFTLGLVAFASSLDDAAAVKARLQTEMNVYVGAMKKKDVKAVEKSILTNFAPEFTETDLKGVKRNRSEIIAMMKRNIASLKTITTMRYDITSVKLAAGKATTNEHMVLEATIQGMGDPKKVSKLKLDATWKSTYEERAKRWICITSKALTQKVTIDGQPIN